jgi:hypothetical protein
MNGHDGPDREIHDADEVGVEEHVIGRDVTAADEVGAEEET